MTTTPNGYQTITIPVVGTLVEMQHKTYEIVSVQVKMAEMDIQVRLGFCPVDDNGDDTGEPVIWANEDMVDFRVI